MYGLQLNESKELPKLLIIVSVTQSVQKKLPSHPLIYFHRDHPSKPKSTINLHAI